MHKRHFAAVVGTAAVSGIMALLLGSSPVQSAITRGPYLQSVTTTSIVVVWDTETVGEASLHYGVEGLDQIAESRSSGFHHEVRLEGLSADTSYTYAVFEDGERLSDDFSFHTAVEGRTPFRFVAYGDTRSDAEAHSRVVQAIAEEGDLAFYINTGDMVSSGENASEWDEFLEIESDLMANIPFFGSIGNHDEDDGNADPYFDAFVMPTNSPQPEAYYSFDYGNAHFVALDGHINVQPWYLCALNGLFMDDCFDPEQLAWLEDDLHQAHARADIDHIFVATHIGPYSSKEGRSGNAHMRALLQLFMNTGVTAIISGHDHYYEHGLTSVGIHYVISGGGGAPLYDISSASFDPHEVFYNESVHHHVVFEVMGEFVRVRAQTTEGRILEEFYIGPEPQCFEASDCIVPSTACEGAISLCIDYECTLDCPPSRTPDPDLAPDAGQTDAGGQDDRASGSNRSFDNEDEPDGAPEVAIEPTESADPAATQTPTHGDTGCGCNSAPGLPKDVSALFAVAFFLAQSVRRRRSTNA